MTGNLFDTYVAALQHDLVELPAGTRLVGVVRRPTPWLYGVVDENVTALSPPSDLLEEVKDRHEALKARGIADATAHNRAMDEAEYEARYLEYLDDAPEADEAIGRIRSLLADDKDVALVCFENTDEKRCHRTLLKQCILAA